MKFEFDLMRRLLRKRVDDPELVALIGRTVPERIGKNGFIELHDMGVSLKFKDASSLLPPSEVKDASKFHLSGILFHRLNHEGYAEYPGQFPSEVVFGDSEADVVRKLGVATTTGGGGKMPVLGTAVPRWIRYNVPDGKLHFQFDGSGALEMVTLFVEPLASR